MLQTSQSIPQDSHSRKGMRHSLSNGAYFDGSTKTRLQPATTDPTKTLRWNMLHVESAQNRRNRNPKPVKIAVHAAMLKITQSNLDKGLVDRPAPQGNRAGLPRLEKEEFTFGGVVGLNIDIRRGATGVNRGEICGFSHASRKRMIELMASIRYTGSTFFVTMTYDDESLQRDNLDFKAEWEAFRRRFERAFPSWSALWRIELQERKSGDLQGSVVPHYHLIVFTDIKYEVDYEKTIAQSIQSWGVVAWQEITSSFNPYHRIYGFKVECIRSRRHAMAYVSKYVSKSTQDNYYIGRRWGRIGTFDTSASETFRLDADEYTVFRRLIRQWMHKKGNGVKGKNRKKAINRAHRLSKRFSKSFPDLGCTVFGLGDCPDDEKGMNLFGGYWQFIAEAKRQVTELRERDRAYGY